MKNLLRALKWVVLGLGSLLVVVTVAVVAYTNTENFTRWAREEAVTAVNGLIRGTVSVERLEGSVWSRITLYDVALQYEQQEILKIPRLDVSFSLLPLIFGRLEIAAIDAAQPRASLLQDPEGRWNVVEALSPRQPEPEKKSDFTVLVESVRLRNAAVELRPVSDNGRLYRLQDLNLHGRIGLRPAGATVEAAEVASVLTARGQPDLRLKGALTYEQGAAAPATLKIKDFWAVSRNSRIKLNGQMTNGEALKIKADAVLDKLAPSDIAYFVAGWPLKRDLAGNISVDGTLDALRGNLQLTGAGANISGKFRADVAQAEPRYSATAVVSGFSLQQWLNDKTLAGVVNGTVEAAGTGFALQNTAAKARLEIQSAEAQGWALGAVSVQGQLQKSVAVFDGSLASKMGGAQWSGKVNLGETRPSYALDFSVKDFAVHKAAQDGKAIDGKLNLQGSVKGSGFTLAEMNTLADVQLLPSTVGAVALKQGIFNVMLRDKKLRIARATLSTAESTLVASGEFGLDANMSGRLDYQLRMADVAPWLSLVGRKAAGAVDVTGHAQGNLADLETRGTARLSGLSVEGSAAKDGNIAFALRGSREQLFPEGTVTARLTDVDAGVALRRLDATAKLSRQPTQTVELDLNAQDRHDRKHGLKGTVNLASDAITARLVQLSLASPDGLWKLARPATLSKRGDAYSIEQFAMKNGDRELVLDGRFAFGGKQDVTLSIDRLPIETLTGFLSEPPKASGLLAGQVRVSGTAAAPEVTASARLSDAKIAGQSYAGASADADYKDRRLALRFVVQQDATHALNGSGAVPLNLSWQDTWRADFADGLDLRAQSSGLSLAFLNAFSGKSVENIAGELSVDVRAQGSVKQPALSGTFRLRDGKLKIVPLGVDVQEVVLGGDLDSRNVNVREFVAKAKDGEIRGSGALALKDYDVGAVKLALKAERWPAIATQRYQIKIAGNVDMQGSLTAPAVTGQITVMEGTLRPDLAFLEQSKVPLKRDETIVVVKKSGASQAPRPVPENGGSSDSQLFKKLTLDVTVRAPGNLWVRHPELVSELSGNVRATKRPDRDFDLTGRIDVVRGSFAFQGRRFQLSRGVVEFTGGGKINPSLDVVAEYRLPEYEVDAIIGGTAEKPSLTLTSQPRLEQADILALLLFGRPVNALNQNERGSVQQSALSITSGYVAGSIANSVSAALGLESLGVDVSGGRVGFGHYVGGKTYVSMSQELSGEHGHEVSMEYQVAPEWKIGTSASSTGTNGIDIIWNKRY